MTARFGLLRTTVLLVAAVPGLAAVLTGCGTTVGVGSAQTDNPPPSASPSPLPSGLRLRDAATAGTGFVVATGFAYNQPAAPGASPAPAGNAWAAADVQSCAPQGTVFPVSISDAAWSLRFGNGTVVNPSHVDDPVFPQPQYPQTPTPLQAGDCVRGWVIFEVPADNRPMLLRYTPQGGAAPIDWQVQ